ncbi:hypothetical protein P3L10_029735 [Capsicum annuum]
MASLTIYECKKLKRLPEGMQELLPSLKELRLSYCPEIESFPVEDCPSIYNSLRSAIARNCYGSNMMAVTKRLLVLGLYNHDELHSLPTEGLQHLTSLRRLDISYCPQLQSLPESVLPSSLSELNIKDCPNLQSLPVKGMPSSLSKLSIRNCPLLEPLVEFDKGEYWPEVAHTSTIEIDDDYL